LLEGTSFYRIGKDDFTQIRTVRSGVGAKDLLPKRRGNGALDVGIFREQFMPAAVGIEDLHGQIPAQGSRESGLSRADTSSNAKSWHRPIYLGMSGSSIGATCGGATVSTTSSFSSSERTGSPAALIKRAVTNMMRLVLRC
jgi:hypothetical protein